MVKNLPAMYETWVWSLDLEYTLGKRMATHSSILAWKISWTEKSGGSHVSWGHKESDSTEWLTLNTRIRGILVSQALKQEFSSVAQSCPTLCDPMDYCTPGLSVHQQLLEFTQTHVHWVGDAIQPSYPLSSPSPPAFNLSQHQGLSKWVSSSHEVAKALEFQLQHQSFQWTLRADLYDGLFGSPCSPRHCQSLLQHHSSKTSVLSFLYSPTLTSIHDHWKNHSLD